ncbi:site-specific DNA-methyltransferase [Staphylococcus aureus]|uniref:site-specific DNA-methyltransferase n=1 Tax=Staphylococcus aureus TaxID=1280 RepID=UPI002175EF4B|nr:site-specific DNA-methyltransferase [Staphylococcus aureus]MCS5222318.1 site-specific DNA-methyltransferase [Staphylococcus aureus]MCS5334852.1 site-specific DNA-methyltransferase [Staphylococcus aureus]MCS5341126.1 site-specific DNA-methyltransferase [Staphylococcus aureus]
MTNERTNERLEEVSSHSLDITEQNIEKLKELFPEVLTEKKIDFDKLRLILGDEVETAPERYSFTWNGKKQAMQLAQQPTVATLKPNKAKSKNWDETQNLYIEGDNLEVLKILQKSYANKVKLIYLDPPYNTGSDFVYQDSFSDSIKNYLEVTGQVDEDGTKFSTNAETSGRYHTNWLNMMYSRLKLGRSLLTDDGVMFISIDEHEISNLEKLVSELFGENNLAGTIIWDKRNPKGDSKGVAMQHEYVIVVAKSLEIFSSKNEFKRLKKNAEGMLRKAKQIINKIGADFTLSDANDEYRKWVNAQDSFSGGERAYSKIDEQGNVYQEVSMTWPNNKQAPADYFVPIIHPTTGKPTKIPGKGWRYPSATLKQMILDNMVVFGKDETTIPRRKYLLSENMYENVPSLYYNGKSGSTDVSNLEMKTTYFDNPKPVDLLKQIIQSTTTENDIILDFFSGSATTAESVMKQNSEDDNNRQFIMVQLPEIIEDKKSDGYKDGFRNIPEIAEERIRRAGDKIIGENPELADKLDIGFKVFELEKSNLKKWNTEPEDLVTMLGSIQDNLEPGSTEDDLVYEIMLKQGLELTLPIEKFVVGDANIYKIAFGSLFIVLGENITSDVAEKIDEFIMDEELENVVVVLQDTGFANDSEKLNSIEILNAGGVDYNDILSI